MKRWLLVIVGYAAGGACGGHAPAPLPLATTATLDPVAVVSITEQGDVTYILGRDKIVIARGDHATTVLPSPHVWGSTASIPALDGEGRWVVTVYDRHLYRIRLDGEIEQIDDRFGLEHDRVMRIAAAGSTVAVLVANAVAVTRDGVHLARYPL